MPYESYHLSFASVIYFTEAFAVVREAAKRKLGMRHFDVQVSITLFVMSMLVCVSICV